MISTERIIYCINPGCNRPINPVGHSVCANCETPLVHRYLWATGSVSTKIRLFSKVANRYEVITPQIWLDTQPGLLPDIPEELPKEVIPYLRLFQEGLHLPQAYGFAPSFKAGASNILLLENVPIDDTGHIYPAIADVWEQATAVRQVYWLWQILQLWKPLLEVGVAQSLLVQDNLRVQGWCVRLVELHQTQPTEKPNLQNLALFWQPWVASAKAPIAQELENIVQQMCETEVELEAIAQQLNQLLLSSAAELPLNLEVAGATHTGPVLAQNEDNCYPNPSDNSDYPLPYLSIVCDGIGGHEGGEVASQLAVQSLKLQIRALLTQIAQQSQYVSLELLQEQLEVNLRVVNNMICARNNEQNRQGRERMATTLVMAVQVPQRVETTTGKQSENAHELYLTNVGDSRAYWITRNYCQLLTVDDDVATREVGLARCMYRKALVRPDATALTQALGIKDAESLRLQVERFILEEDGILLLCSDGLSDNNWVEQSWQNYAIPVLTGQLTVEDAARNWVKLANEKNGHDNASVVLTYCRVSPESLVQPLGEILEPEPFSLAETPILLNLDLDLDLTEEPPIITQKTTLTKKPRRGKPQLTLGRVLVLLMVGTSLGLFGWSQLNPQAFQQMCRQLPQRVQRLCLPAK